MNTCAESCGDCIAKEYMDRKVFNEGGTDLKGNAGRNCEWDYGNLIEHPKNENIFALNLRNFQG